MKAFFVSKKWFLVIMTITAISISALGQITQSITAYEASSFKARAAKAVLSADWKAERSQSIHVESPTLAWQTAEGALNVTITCDDGAGYFFAQSQTPTAAGNCGTITYYKTEGPFIQGECGGTGTYRNTWTATDECENTSPVFEQVITIINPPNIVFVEGAVIPGGSGNKSCKSNVPPAPDIYTIAALYNGCSVSAGLASSSITGTDCNWIATYTFRIVDGCGNTAPDLVITFSGGDKFPPSRIGPSPSGPFFSRAQCMSDFATPRNPALLLPFFADCGAFTITYVPEGSGITGTDCSWQSGYNYDVTDECGNTLRYRLENFGGLQNPPYPKEDAQFPGEENISACKADAPPAPSTASIAALYFPCSAGGISVTLVSSDVTGDDCNWTATYLYHVANECAFFLPLTIIYSGGDKTAPSIVITPAAKLPCNPTRSQIEAAFGSASVTDCISGLIATGIVGTETSSGCTYATTKTWTATDACGNIATATQTVSYIKQTGVPPVLYCPPPVTVNCNAGSASPLNTGTATATSVCGVITITYSDAITITRRTGNTVNFSIFRTWKAIDVCGNTSTCVQIIRFENSSPPKILCPPDKSINCNESTAPSNTGTISFSNYCAPILSVTYTDQSDYDVNPNSNKHYNYTIHRKWTATDAAGSQSTCIQKIIVKDVIAPVIVCPPNRSLTTCIGCSATTTAGTATGTDNCSPVTITGKRNDGKLLIAAYPAGTTTITWTAIDVSGNKSTCQQTIFVSSLPDADKDGTPDVYDCAPFNAKNTDYIMCHNGKQECVEAGTVQKKIDQKGEKWTLGGCVPSNCAGNEILLCHNGIPECVKTADSDAKLRDTKHWSTFPCTISQRSISRATADPEKYTLSNYPNPLNQLTRIEYGLPLESRVYLKVYDLMGREVNTLVNATQSAGTYMIDYNAGKLSAGIYYFSLTAIANGKVHVETRKMVIVR